MMLSIYVNETKKDIVVAVQKSGFAWALDQDNGSLVWSTEAGLGGITGAEHRVQPLIARLSKPTLITLTPRISLSIHQ
ncbi:hypothetical protein REPUB_Repub10bG0040100 [Reevesia pubescens]